MNPYYPAVAFRAGNRCEYCHAPGAIFNLSLEVEHIVPVSQGGSDNYDNLALACRACNVYKSNRLTATDPNTGKIVPLFHPRRHLWKRHFHFDDTIGELRGRTQAGRATVICLQLNSPQQIAARQQWVALALFP